MSYVIRRNDQGGGFVAKPNSGNGASYTRSLRDAQKYATREAAKHNCCENESVVDLEGLLDETDGEVNPGGSP